MSIELDCNNSEHDRAHSGRLKQGRYHEHCVDIQSKEK